MQETNRFETVIVGAGFGGLCMGERLRRSGRTDFVILEKAREVGGTWRENTYPGAECDVPSALYSLSFAQNPTWSFKWAKQAQILDYLKRCYAQFDLVPHLRFGCGVTRADYDEPRRLWRVTTTMGEVLECRFFVTAVGQLHHPHIPDLAHSERFAGHSFHSAQWRHDIALQGRRVAVVGSAASAIQLIPDVAAQAQTLTVYQRSPNWILPKGDRQYSKFEHWLARRVPALANVYRLGIFCYAEYGLYPMIRGSRLHRAFGVWRCKRAIRRDVADPALRRALVPDYPIGAKRILFSDRYYEALARANVELVTAPIERMEPSAIVCADGSRRAHDVVIYATGFKTNPFLQSMTIRGRGGAVLREHWHDGAFAYLGVATSGFPNLFLLYGPNTNTGHMSVVFMLENQAARIAALIDAAGDGAAEVDEGHERAFNAALQARLERMVWSQVRDNWYKDGDKVTNNWPGSALEYRRRLRTLQPTAFRFD